MCVCVCNEGIKAMDKSSFMHNNTGYEQLQIITLISEQQAKTVLKQLYVEKEV